MKQAEFERRVKYLRDRGYNVDMLSPDDIITIYDKLKGTSQ